MKNNELVFRHKISDNKVVLYLMVCAFAIIISLGVSVKCSAAVSELAYFDGYATQEEYSHSYDEQDKLISEYIQKFCPTDPNDYNRNRVYARKRLSERHLPEEWCYIQQINNRFEDENKKATVLLYFIVNKINYDTNYCDIYINGELEDTIELIEGKRIMLCLLPPERFSKSAAYSVEIVTKDKDGNEIRDAYDYGTKRPLILEKNLIDKIENTQDNSGLKIEWKDLGEVKSYYVYRAKEKDGFYKLMGITYEPYLVDEDVEAGQSYYYHVVANFINDETLQSADVEGSLKPIESLAADNNGQTTNDKENINKSENTSDNKITLNKPKISIKKKTKTWQIYWGIISDKSMGIDIYMKNGYGKYKKYRKINTTTKLKKSKNKKGAVGITSSKKSLIKGVKYQFKARTFYYKTNGRKVYSKWSNVIKLKR